MSAAFRRVHIAAGIELRYCPGNDIPITGEDLSAAVDQLCQAKPIQVEQRPSMGCNIKWRKGNEPEYFG